MKTIINKLLAFSVVLCLAGCSFLNDNVPQATLSEEEVRDPKQIDNMVISAYAIFISAEDINSSFSMWNFDVRSDDAYKGGNGESDGDVFHQLEISRGILTTNWNINDMWSRLYNCLSRVNAAIDVLLEMDDSYTPTPLIPTTKGGVSLSRIWRTPIRCCPLLRKTKDVLPKLPLRRSWQRPISTRRIVRTTLLPIK